MNRIILLDSQVKSKTNNCLLPLKQLPQTPTMQSDLKIQQNPPQLDQQLSKGPGKRINTILLPQSVPDTEPESKSKRNMIASKFRRPGGRLLIRNKASGTRLKEEILQR